MVFHGVLGVLALSPTHPRALGWRSFGNVLGKGCKSQTRSWANLSRGTQLGLHRGQSRGVLWAGAKPLSPQIDLRSVMRSEASRDALPLGRVHLPSGYPRMPDPHRRGVLGVQTSPPSRAWLWRPRHAADGVCAVARLKHPFLLPAMQVSSASSARCDR